MNHYNIPKHKFDPCPTFNLDRYIHPRELTCIQVPKVFDHVFTRDCKLLKIKLNNCPQCCEPGVFEGICNAYVKNVKIKSCLDIPDKPKCKKIKLAITVKFNIKLSNKKSCILQPYQATFNIEIKKIYCPGTPCCAHEIRFPKNNILLTSSCFDFDNNLIDIDVLPKIISHEIDLENNVLFIEMGCFFVVTSLCVVRLLVPSYGYCPVENEQVNPLLYSNSCFCDHQKHPFPTELFPD